MTLKEYTKADWDRLSNQEKEEYCMQLTSYFREYYYPCWEWLQSPTHEKAANHIASLECLVTGERILPFSTVQSLYTIFELIELKGLINSPIYEGLDTQEVADILDDLGRTFQHVYGSTRTALTREFFKAALRVSMRKLADRLVI